MRRRIGGLLVALLLAGGLVAVVMAEEGIRWVGGEAAINISESEDVLDETSLALGAGRVAVIWAGETAEKGTFLAETQTGDWITTPLALTGDQATWYPAAAYSGTQVVAAWAQGAARYPRTLPRAVMQQDQGSVQAQTVISPVFGDVDLDLVVGPTGMHMVFAATSDSSKYTQGDLYYTHRYFTETAWAPPTVIITHAQAIPVAEWTANMAAGIWSPRLALSADGTVLNLVWRQSQNEIQVLTYTVRHVVGNWTPSGAVWGTPSQVSPPEQRYTVQPSVVIGDDNKVHIVWSELDPGAGGISNPDAQYINYLRVGDASPVKISGRPIRVNNNKPTWATSSIAANGENLCAVWHGFYTGDKEEIIMRCSLDSGTSWNTLVNVSDSPTLLSLLPTIKVDGAGRAHVSWVELELVGSSFTNADLYYRTGSSQVTAVFLPLVLRK